MAKKELTPTFTFVNPNTQKEFENALKIILVERLLSMSTGAEKTCTDHQERSCHR